MGRTESEKIRPITDFHEIQELMSRCEQMYRIVSSGLPFPSNGYPETTKGLSLLRIENSVLSEERFMEILQMMHVVNDIYRFFKNRAGIFPSLEAITADVPYEPSVIRLIEEILDETGLVRTTASPALASIRRSLSRSRTEADRIYQQVINRFRKQGWLTESEESSRAGRRVIAIQAEQKRTVKGFIHDTSATGKTAFLEPEEAMGINQTIYHLEQEERLEIQRILRELSNTLRPFVPLMLKYRQQLGIFDINLAKAQLAKSIDGRFPKLLNESAFDLRQARHPLLVLHNQKLKQPTIPFDLKLDREQRILVISGPNAGGKTVCMKTSGLLQMMIQSGLPVSASEDSVFGIFGNLMVDIGDSQSIEYELSTYSSRLKHMKVFLEQVDEKSLFLIDEFGTGTDPNLGGALAEAILEELNEKKSCGIITTHYLNLKVLADKTPGIFNGSMEFDLKRLKPLFRLVTGKPGSSYTFLVAERSGLPRHVIKKARRMVPRKNLMLEKLLTEVQHEKELLQQKLSQVRENDHQLKEQIRRYEVFQRTTQEKIIQLEQKVKKSDERLKRETEERFRNFLKEWKKAKDKKEVFDKYYKLFVQKKKTESPAAIEKKRQEKLARIKAILKPGMLVRLVNGSTTGVVDKIDNEKAFVIFGQFKTECELTGLEIVEHTEKKKIKTVSR